MATTLAKQEGKVLTGAAYGRLLRDVRGMLEAGRVEAEQAVGSVLADTYWQVGRRIADAALTERAGYGDATLRKLATELALELRTLERAVQFARAYPERPAPGLSWAHYRALIAVADPQARRWYERQARREGWATRALSAALKREAFEAEGRGGKRRGGKAAATLSRPKAATFVYRGLVERVLDGDTVEMRLDLGFDVWRVQTIRLAAVEAAPLDSAAGRAARDFVLETLARATQVVVKTEQYDVHMRYMGHVMYAHRPMEDEAVFARGRYLNDELLRRGLVTRY